MDALTSHVLTVFMGYFAIMNPLANTPVFLGLTATDDPDVRRRVALKSLALAFGIVVFFALAGQAIFHLFGITLPALRIMGGVLVALVGYGMLHGGEHSPVQHPSDTDKQRCIDEQLEVAITPLAMPILAGPGTIATTMNFASAGGGSLQAWLVTVGTFGVLCAITYAFFVSGERLVRVVGDGGIKVVTRLMGLILAVIGVQMLIDGVGGAVAAFHVPG